MSHAHETPPPGALRGRVARVIVLVFGLNLLVAATKIAIGFLSHNLTVVSDGFHGLLDAGNNVVGLAALYISWRPPDANHPYGHRKIEALVALAIGGAMALTSWEILRAIARRLLTGESPHPESVNPWFLAALAITFTANLLISTYEKRRGEAYRSAFLIADAAHTRTHMAMDALAVGSLLLAPRIPLLDNLLALVVVVYILRAGWSIVRDNALILTDATRLDPEPIRRLAESIRDVENCHAIRSHGMPDDVHLDLHIVVAPNLSAERTQQVESEVRRAIFEKFPQVTEVAIHHQTQPPRTESPQPLRREDNAAG